MYISLHKDGKIYEKEINFSDPELEEEEEDLSKPQEENN